MEFCIGSRYLLNFTSTNWAVLNRIYQLSVVQDTDFKLSSHRNTHSDFRVSRTCFLQYLTEIFLREMKLLKAFCNRTKHNDCLVLTFFPFSTCPRTTTKMQACNPLQNIESLSLREKYDLQIHFCSSCFFGQGMNTRTGPAARKAEESGRLCHSSF